MHSFVCQLCTCSYTIIIANSEPPTFLPFSLTWHARWTQQRGSELEKAHRACEMTYLPPLLLSLYSLMRGPHMLALSSTSSNGWEPGTSSFISHLQHLDGSQAPLASSSLHGCCAQSRWRSSCGKDGLVAASHG